MVILSMEVMPSFALKHCQFVSTKTIGRSGCVVLNKADRHKSRARVSIGHSAEKVKQD